MIAKQALIRIMRRHGMLQARSAHLQSTKGQSYKSALEGARGTPTCEHCSGLGRGDAPPNLGEAPPNSWPLPLQFDGVVHETAGQAGRTMGDRRHRFEHFNISDCVSTPHAPCRHPHAELFARARLRAISIFVIASLLHALSTRDRRSCSDFTLSFIDVFDSV